MTVLSSDDPVRVFQEFATLDLLSGGRAEVMAGRGSFIESFPLFGYDLDHYDELFAEKLELLLALRASTEVTWSGRHRAPIQGQGVYPRPVQTPLPVWIAVGGPEGALMVGDPDEVAAKIVRQHELFGHDRFTAQISVGPLAHEHVMRSIDLLGTEVAPRVRAALPGRVPAIAT